MPNIAQPSVQSLFIQMRFNGQPLASGTGFIVNSNQGSPLLITNRHNVTGRNPETNQPLSNTGGIPNEIVIVHNRSGHLGQWIERVEPLYSNNEPLWIEHPQLGARGDFVALKLTQTDDVITYPYNISDNNPDIFVGPSDSVSVIGFPFGITAGGACGVWATGFMASEPVINFAELPVFLIDCRSRQGQSGSPVIAYRSGGAVAMSDGGSSIFNGPVYKFLGIYSGRINSESDLGIVWKKDAIKELVDTAV
jgi:hypothetical protein